MSPSPAFNPVEPPSGRIICSLRAPELSATSSIDLIITAMASISLNSLSFRRGAKRRGGTCFDRHPQGPSSPLQPPLPEPAAPCAQCLSASSASASTGDESPRSAPRRPHALRSSHRGRKTSCCAPPPAAKTDAPSCASLSPQSSSACGWRRLLQPLPCGALALFPLPGLRDWFPPLSFLRCGRALALAADRLDARNVLAQPANLLQTLRLPHVQLKFQLEELVGELAFLVAKLLFRQVSDFVCLHKSP